MFRYQFFFFALCAARTSYGGLSDESTCNPLAPDSNCSPDSAFVGKASFDFDDAGWNNDFEAFWSVDEATKHDRKRLDFVTKGSGISMAMTDMNQAPTLTSKHYLFFGKVSVTMKAAKGPGLVSTIVLKSDSGDEIDWEMLGAFEHQAQSNYYSKAQPLFNTYNTTYTLPTSSSYDAFHTYTVEWTDTFLKFSIDGSERKTWQVGSGSDGNSIPAEKWPQVPMRVQLGLWAVESGNDAGEIAWAGGVPDWRQEPFKAYFKKVEVEDYTGWCEEVVAGNVEYSYGADTKGWADVKVAGCRKRRAPGVISPDPPKGTSTTTGDGGAAEETGKDAPDEEGGAGCIAMRASGALVALVGLVWIALL